MSTDSDQPESSGQGKSSLTSALETQRIYLLREEQIKPFAWPPSLASGAAPSPFSITFDALRDLLLAGRSVKLCCVIAGDGGHDSQ